MLVAVIYFTLVYILLICIIESADIPSDFKYDVFIIKFLSFFTGILFMVIIYLFLEFLCPSITPMDVYSGKTTLEYTVVDGIKTDSCVVWEKDIKKVIP